MNKKQKRDIRRLPSNVIRRFAQAERELHRLEEDIAPFVRRKKIGVFSAMGKWRTTSSLLVEEEI